MRLLALIATLVVFIAACGGGEEPVSDGIASVDDVETTTTTTASSAVATDEETADDDTDDTDDAVVEESAVGEATPTTTAVTAGNAQISDDPEDISSIEEQELAVLALSACMREQGIENFPDIGVGPDGALDLAAVFQSGVDLQSPDFATALQACQDNVADITFSAAAVPDPAAIADQLFGFTQCLRDEGLDVGDVAVTELLTRQSAVPANVSSPEEGIAYFFGLDPNDPAVLAAIDACGSELIGLPGT